jgi:hypothetical protein
MRVGSVSESRIAPPTTCIRPVTVPVYGGQLGRRPFGPAPTSTGGVGIFPPAMGFAVVISSPSTSRRGCGQDPFRKAGT